MSDSRFRLNHFSLQFDDTAVHLAAKAGHLNVIQCLQKHEADLNAVNGVSISAGVCSYWRVYVSSFVYNNCFCIIPSNMLAHAQYDDD